MGIVFYQKRTAPAACVTYTFYNSHIGEIAVAEYRRYGSLLSCGSRTRRGIGVKPTNIPHPYIILRCGTLRSNTSERIGVKDSMNRNQDRQKVIDGGISKCGLTACRTSTPTRLFSSHDHKRPPPYETRHAVHI